MLAGSPRGLAFRSDERKGMEHWILWIDPIRQKVGAEGLASHLFHRFSLRRRPLPQQLVLLFTDRGLH